LLALPASAGNLTLRVDGGAEAGSFEGAVNLRGFAADGDSLVALATLSGALRDAEGKRLASADDLALRLPVAGGSLRASCEQLAMRLGPYEVLIGGQRVRLEPIELEVPARAGGAPLRDLLCALERSLRGSPAQAELARALDAVLAALG
jgi:hypothetical protein